MRTSALFGEKNFKFLEIYGVSTRTRRLSQCGHFADKEGGSQFLAFLCGRLLWTVPYGHSLQLSMRYACALMLAWRMMLHECFKKKTLRFHQSSY